MSDGGRGELAGGVVPLDGGGEPGGLLAEPCEQRTGLYLVPVVPRPFELDFAVRITLAATGLDGFVCRLFSSRTGTIRAVYAHARDGRAALATAAAR